MVCENFVQFSTRVRAALPDVQIIYLAVLKYVPSPALPVYKIPVVSTTLMPVGHMDILHLEDVRDAPLAQ